MGHISQLYSLYKENPVVTTDSRQAAPGMIFFALKGDNFNGNQFAEKAIAQGCSVAVIDERAYDKGDRYILVKDVLQTLQELAKFHRAQLKIPVIAITGSNGKTTTKELVREVLAKKYKVLATAGNLNNHIGVPLTLLGITPQVEVAIIEMGANHVGEIAQLCEIADPDIGFITNIGRAHIGEFGSFEAIVKAKTELYDFLRKHNRKVFLNSGNELLREKAAGLEQVTYGRQTTDFCQPILIGADPFVKVKYDGCEITSQLIGKYNYENIAAAICLGKYFGVETAKMREAVEGYIPSNNRSQVVMKGPNRLILDAYNANPSSMKAAIENFYEMAGENKWLILGDMRELGNYSAAEHSAILRLLEEKELKNVLLVGSYFSEAVAGAKGAAKEFRVFSDTDKLIEALKSNSPIKGPAMILVKGSRGIRLEKAVEFL